MEESFQLELIRHSEWKLELCFGTKFRRFSLNFIIITRFPNIRHHSIQQKSNLIDFLVKMLVCH
jgi:hypothetical protein